ncbi:MAG: hypothetical protein AAF682_06875 [Planctomycetota bacterium]
MRLAWWIVGPLFAAPALLISPSSCGGPSGTPARPVGAERGEAPRPDAALLAPLGGGSAAVAAAGRQAAEAPAERVLAEVSEPATAGLFVRLVERAGGEPLASEVELWQLGLPADDRWTAGDRLHAVADVPAEGHLFEGLPPGRYRAYVRARRHAGRDSRELRVVAPRTEAELVVDTPRMARFYLDLRDLDGQPIDEVRPSSSWRSMLAPNAPFARARERKDEPVNDVIGIGGGGGGSFGTRRLLRGELGFHLGVHAERSCEDGVARSLRLRPKGCATVRGEVEGYVEPPDGTDLDDPDLPVHTLVATAVPNGWFDESIFLPGGALAAESGARLHIWSYPVPLAPDAPADAWRDAPIEVTVRLEGYETLKVRTTAREGLPDGRVLTPRPPRD